MIIFSIKRGEDDPSTKVLEEKLRLNESGCQYWHLTNDQICDDEANTEGCYFDLDDCCDYQNDFTLCQDCFCYSKHSVNYTLLADCSIDQDILWNWYYGGDDKCQLHLNYVENFFDAGDCCLNYTQCENIFQATNPWGAAMEKSFDVDCPIDVCIRSDMYCIPELSGDGVCHDNNNSKLCDYDLGDCCKPNLITDSCCDCSCKKNE